MRAMRKSNRWLLGLGIVFVFGATQNCQCQFGNSFRNVGAPSPPISSPQASSSVQAPLSIPPTTTSLLTEIQPTPAPASLLADTQESEALTVTARTAHGVLLAGTPQRSYLKIDLQGAQMDGTQRPPLNVALVIDRSGSMAGVKLQQAKQAVAMVLRTLRPDDQVTIVAYDSSVQVIAKPTRAVDPEILISRVAGIQAGHTTNLYDGVYKGAELLETQRDAEHVNRLVLLSDGLANCGRTSVFDMRRLGEKLAGKGVSITTIGLGTGYDPGTLTALAESSEGNHFFARRAEDLKEGFGLEFTRGLAVVASDVTIRVRLHPRVRLGQVLNAQPSLIAGQEIQVQRTQLYGNHTAFLLLELKMPPGEDGQELELAQVRVDFVKLSTGTSESVGSRARVEYSDDRDDVRDSEQADVMVAVAGVLGNRRAQEARRLYEAGRLDEARREFSAASQYLDKNGRRYHSSQLQDLARLNQQMALKPTPQAIRSHYQHENLKTFGRNNMGANPY